MRNNLLFLFLVTIVFPFGKISAQNLGPAGLPAANNALWLRADEVDTTDLAPVRLWNDKSFNNNDALQNQITNAPTLYKFPGTNNNKPFVSFLGSNDQLIVFDKPGSKLDSTAQMTVISAIRPKGTASLTTAADDANAIISKRSDCNASRNNWTCSDYSLFIWDGGKVYTDVVSDNNRFATGNAFLTDNQTSLIGLTFNGQQPANDRVKIYRNGNLELTAANEAANFIPNSNSALVIAAMDSGSLNSFKSLQADIYEIVIFNRLLNNAERQIVENYMSSRYNITIPNDYYAHDAFNTLNWFGEDVSGVGRFNSFERHLTGTSAQLTLSNPSNMNSGTTADNGKYLLFGNNGGDINSWNNIFGASNNILSIDRKWRIDEKNRINILFNGDAGAFTVNIDTASLPNKPTGFTKYVLIVDNDFDFANGNQVYELVYNPTTGRYMGTNINFNDGDIITIGVLKPEIQFEFPVSSGNEFNNASVKVMLNYIAESPVTINYNTVYVNSARGNNEFCLDSINYVFGNDCFECYLNPIAGDYKDTSGTLTILKGTSFSNVVVRVYDDVCGSDADDVGEYFDIQIQNPSAGVVLGSNSTHRYFITDDDDSRIIRFTNTTSTVNENVGVLQVQVQLNNASPNNNTKVEYYIQGISATNLADYMEDSTLTGNLIFGEVNILPNTTTANILIDVKDDLLYEFTENAKIVLFNSTNGRLTSITSQKEHTFTITDNDMKPKVNLTQSSYTINEDIGILNVEVALSAKSGVPVLVYFKGSNNSAIRSGTFADYAYGNGSVLTINPGTLDTTIRLVILDDARIEANEEITLNIDSVKNADLGTALISNITILDNDVIGITGPGGVGDSSINVLWLRADDITGIANGAAVPSWNDASGNGFVATQSTNRPVYVASTSTMNNRPSISFSGSANPLEINDNPLLDNATEYSIFVAARVNTTASSVGILEKRTSSNPTTFNVTNSYFLGISRVSGTDFRYIADFNTSNLRRTQPGSPNNYNTSTVLNSRIYSAFFNGTVASPQKIRIGADNVLMSATGNNQPADLFKINNSTARLRIGSGSAGGSGNFNGNIAEVIMYRSALNDAQRTIVNNYLSSKYGIAITNDFYTQESIGFGNEVAGIGQLNGFAHSAAKGKGIVTIGWPTGMQDNEWLFFGHNNGSITTLETTDKPSFAEDRYSRIWTVNETGDVGTVTISFDLNPYSSADPNTLVLLRSNTLSFANATLDSSNRVYDAVRKRITFSGINLSNGEFFTIGRMSGAALPVELIAFDAEQQENKVVVTWSTATEINADYFEVERSVNGVEFETIGKVSAAGNSVAQIDYRLIDEQPLEGISYYRLKQVDYDGAYEYFGPVSVSFEKNKGAIKVAVYPNPLMDNNHLNIVVAGIEKAENVQVNIYNSLGQIVKNSTFVCEKNCTQILELNDFALGNYYIEIIHASNRYIQKFTKQ